MLKAHKAGVRKEEARAREERARADRAHAERIKACTTTLREVKEAIDEAMRFAVTKNKLVWRRARTHIWPKKVPYFHGLGMTGHGEEIRWVHRYPADYTTRNGEPFSFFWTYPGANTGDFEFSVQLDDVYWRIKAKTTNGSTLYDGIIVAPYGDMPDEVGRVQSTFPSGFCKEFKRAFVREL